MTKVRSSDGKMIDDRRGRSSGGGGFPGLGGGGGGGFPFPMKAGGGLLGMIVVIAAMVLPQLLGAGSPSSTGLAGGTGEPSAESADGTCSSDL